MWSLKVLLLISFAIFCSADSEETVTAASIELTTANFDLETDGKNVLAVFYSPR